MKFDLCDIEDVYKGEPVFVNITNIETEGLHDFSPYDCFVSWESSYVCNAITGQEIKVDDDYLVNFIGKYMPPRNKKINYDYED